MPDRVSAELLAIINAVIASKGGEPVSRIDGNMEFRNDLGFDSFDLAELTARIDHRFDVDVFANGIVATVGDVQELIERRRG